MPLVDVVRPARAVAIDWSAIRACRVTFHQRHESITIDNKINRFVIHRDGHRHHRAVRPLAWNHVGAYPSKQESEEPLSDAPPPVPDGMQQQQQHTSGALARFCCPSTFTASISAGASVAQPTVLRDTE